MGKTWDDGTCLLAMAICFGAAHLPYIQSVNPPAAAPPAASPRSISPPLASSSSSSSSMAVQAFPVSSAADLRNAFMSRSSLIYLQNNITLSNDVFPSDLSLTIGQSNNITLAPAPNISSTLVLDFGYFLTERITIATSSVLTIQGLQLLNYYFPSLDATPTDTFLPFFSVLPGAIVNCTAVRFQIDPARCASTPNYAVASNAVRIPWLKSEHPELLSMQVLDNNEVQVNTARVSQNFERINASYAQPLSGSGDIEISSSIFFCAVNLTAPDDNSSSTFSSVATSPELLDELEELDSRSIYIENNIRVGIDDWSMTQVVANYRQVVLRSAFPNLPSSPGNDSVPSELYIQDSSDVLEAGYGGNLTFMDLNLTFDSVCCTSQQLLGTWYVNQQPLVGSLFNDLLPAALNALPVHTVGLAPPAFLSMENVQIALGQCDTTRFPSIAQSLISALGSNPASQGNASYRSSGHSVSCAYCLLQGTATQPVNFSSSSSFSRVHLINTTIRCGSFVDIALPPALAPAPSLATINGAGPPPPPGQLATQPAASSHHRFSPAASVVASVIVAVCVVVTIFIVGLWAWLQWDYRELQAAYTHLLDDGRVSDSEQNFLT